MQILEELDELRESSPVEFFRGAFMDLDDYTRLQRLHHILSRTQSVCVVPTVCHLRCLFAHPLTKSHLHRWCLKSQNPFPPPW